MGFFVEPERRFYTRRGSSSAVSSTALRRRHLSLEGRSRIGILGSDRLRLTGRSPGECEQRYVRLCEQFLPWSAREDKQLFQLSLAHRRSYVHNTRVTCK